MGDTERITLAELWTDRSERRKVLRVVDARALVRFHDAALSGELRAEAENGLSEVWTAIRDNHRCNRLLWDEEDKARRTDVPDAYIAECKRHIDRHNQERNDAVEVIDERLLAALSAFKPANGARLNSETAGAMVDRLSILALKIHHMRSQTRRTDATAEHVARCRAKSGLQCRSRERAWQRQRYA